MCASIAVLVLSLTPALVALRTNPVAATGGQAQRPAGALDHSVGD